MLPRPAVRSVLARRFTRRVALLVWVKVADVADAGLVFGVGVLLATTVRSSQVRPEGNSDG
jgi:hypothetical protein